MLILQTTNLWLFLRLGRGLVHRGKAPASELLLFSSCPFCPLDPSGENFFIYFFWFSLEWELRSNHVGAGDWTRVLCENSQWAIWTISPAHCVVFEIVLLKTRLSLNLLMQLGLAWDSWSSCPNLTKYWNYIGVLLSSQYKVLSFYPQLFSFNEKSDGDWDSEVFAFIVYRHLSSSALNIMC